MSSAQDGRFYGHYKGGLYRVHRARVQLTDDAKAGDWLTTYQHVGGAEYARPVVIFEGRAEVGRLLVPRFHMLKEDFKLDPTTWDNVDLEIRPEGEGR